MSDNRDTKPRECIVKYDFQDMWWVVTHIDVTGLNIRNHIALNFIEASAYKDLEAKLEAAAKRSCDLMREAEDLIEHLKDKLEAEKRLSETIIAQLQRANLAMTNALEDKLDEANRTIETLTEAFKDIQGTDTVKSTTDDDEQEYWYSSLEVDAIIEDALAKIGGEG